MTSTDSSLPAALTGLDAVFDHACHAAPSIRALLPVYAGLLGGRFVQGGDNGRVGYRAVQLAFADGTRIELMEPLSGSTFLDSFFARNPRGGLHHITFKVADIHEAIRRIEGLGFTATAAFLDDLEWQEVFLHPREASGVLVQLAHAGSENGWEGAETLETVLAGRGPGGDGIHSPE